MELNLKDFVSILDIIKGLSWGSIPLWLSIGIPIYYSFLKKLTSSTPVEGVVPFDAMGKIKQFFTLPKFEKWVSVLCVSLFILGTFTIVIDREQSEEVRNNGLRMKNYMMEKGYYSMPITSFGQLELQEKDIKKVLKQYPKEFVKIKAGNPADTLKGATILLTDSLLLTTILSKTEKILDAYLSTYNSCVTMDYLFDKNNLFTYRVCYKLLADSSHKYYFTGDCSGQKGIGKIAH